MNEEKAVCIEYTNYRGKFGTRNVIPTTIRFDSNEWHPEPQWLLDAYDIDKHANRSFALKEIKSWKPLGDK